MKLHADPHSPLNTVTACGEDRIAINGQTYRRSLLLLPDRIDAGWGPDGMTDLNTAQIEIIARTPGDVILLGTGRRQRFPPPARLRAIYESGRSVDVMDTPAACRTYNLLMLEGRLVVAALIIDAP